MKIVCLEHGCMRKTGRKAGPECRGQCLEAGVYARPQATLGWKRAPLDPDEPSDSVSKSTKT
jgi:hypothetical protein